MKTFLMTAIAVGAMALHAGPAMAQEVESRAIEAKNLAKGKHTIAPDRAYILMSSNARAQGLFFKTADEADLALFMEDWEKQYAKARKKYESKLASYEKQQAEIAKGSLASNTVRLEKPDLVSRGTFSIGSVERRLTAGFGPMFAFDKSEGPDGEDVYSYLIELDPGEYTYYGPIFLNPNGAAFGTCMCMGSVKVDAKPGVVTNLGDFLAMRWVDAEGWRQAGINAAEMADRRPPVSAIDYTVPAALQGHAVVEADWRAAGKVDNWYGIMIGRLPPMDGVLAYERDRIVDLKARPASVAVAPVSPVAAGAISAEPNGEAAID